MVWTNVPGSVGVAGGERLHPGGTVKLRPKEPAHLFFLALTQVFEHVVKNREKVVTVPNLVKTSVGPTCSPVAPALYVQQPVDPVCQVFGFRAELACLPGVSRPIKQLGDKAHSG